MISRRRLRTRYDAPPPPEPPVTVQPVSPFAPAAVGEPETDPGPRGFEGRAADVAPLPDGGPAASSSSSASARSRS